MMNNRENNYIRIPEDIDFLLECCRELLRKVKDYNPNDDLPVSFEQIRRLKSIEQTYRK